MSFTSKISEKEKYSAYQSIGKLEVFLGLNQRPGIHANNNKCMH